MPATSSTPGDVWTALTWSGYKPCRVNVLVTGGAGFIGANLCRALDEAGDVEEVVALDDLSTGPPGQSRRRRRASSSSRARSSTPPSSTPPSTAPTPSSTWPRARRCPGRSRTPGPPTRPTPRAPWPSWRPSAAGRRRARPHVIVASSSSVYGANPALPKREDMVARPLSPYAASKLAGRGLRPGLRPLLRPRRPRLPLLQRLRAPPGGRPRLRGRGARLRGRRPAGRAPHHPRRRDPDPGLHLRGHRGRPSSSTRCDRRVTHDTPVNLAFGSRVSLLELVGALEAVLGHGRCPGRTRTPARATWPTHRPIRASCGPWCPMCGPWAWPTACGPRWTGSRL